MLFQFSDMKWHDSKTNKIYTVIAISKQINQMIGMLMGWKYQSQFLEAFYNLFCIYRLKPKDSIAEKRILNIKIYIITCYLFAVTGFIGVLIFLLTDKNVSFSNLAIYLFHGSEFQYNSSVIINLTTFMLLVLLLTGDILNDIKSCQTTDSLYLIGTKYGLIYKGTKLITKPFSLHIPTTIVIDLCNIIFVIATSRNNIQICKVILDLVYLSMLLYCAGSLNTVHKKISNALSKIQNSKENLDFVNVKNIVLLQMSQEKLEMTAGGCFPLSFRDFTEVCENFARNCANFIIIYFIASWCGHFYYFISDANTRLKITFFETTAARNFFSNVLFVRTSSSSHYSRAHSRGKTDFTYEDVTNCKENRIIANIYSYVLG